MKYCQSIRDIPTVEHFAALVFGSIHIPGDERSRPAPGHGYPERTETRINYIAFDDQQECETWVEQEESTRYGSRNYQLIVAKPCGVSRKTTVEISK